MGTLADTAMDRQRRRLLQLGAGLNASALAMALGLAGGTMLVLLLIDLAIAYLSRALPQMNAMMLGFQVKAAVTLLMLALSAPVLGTVVLNLLSHALAAIARMAEP